MSVSKGDCAHRLEEESKKGPRRWRSTRFLLSYLASAGLCVVFMQRVSLSMAIVCMVNHTALDVRRQHQQEHLNTSAGVAENGFNVSTNPAGVGNDVFIVTPNRSLLTGDQRCHRTSDDEASQQSKEDGPFVWDKQTQGLLLAALYVGYTVMQIPGSYIIHRRGVRVMAGGSVALMSVCHALCHPAAILSPWAVMALRVVMGVSTATTIPALYGVWGRWAPKTEISQLLGITFAGQMIANAVVFPFSALLCEYGFWGGWPLVFYVFAGLGVVWSAAWVFMVTDSPETHPGIHAGERDFIVSTRADATSSGSKLKVPWRSILKSPCFWAIAVGHFVYDWGFFQMISNLPIFLYETMNFDIKSNGAYSMLPYMALFLVLSGTGFICDSVIRRRLLSVLAVRKLVTVVAYMTSAVLLVVMSHLPCEQVAAVVGLLVVAVAVTGLAITGGFFLNPYDVAPRYAVHILTATNTMATVGGIINPYLVAAITTDQTREQWQTVFYVTAGIFLVGTIVFCLFAKANVQKWARPPDDEIECTVLNTPDKHTDARTLLNTPDKHTDARALLKTPEKDTDARALLNTPDNDTDARALLNTPDKHTDARALLNTPDKDTDARALLNTPGKDSMGRIDACTVLNTPDDNTV